MNNPLPYNFVGNPLSMFDACDVHLEDCAMRLRALALLPEISYRDTSAVQVNARWNVLDYINARYRLHADGPTPKNVGELA